MAIDTTSKTGQWIPGLIPNPPGGRGGESLEMEREPGNEASEFLDSFRGKSLGMRPIDS